jgi:hypothetical protein
MIESISKVFKLGLINALVMVINPGTIHTKQTTA